MAAVTQKKSDAETALSVALANLLDAAKKTGVQTIVSMRDYSKGVAMTQCHIAGTPSVSKARVVLDALRDVLVESKIQGNELYADDEDIVTVNAVMNVLHLWSDKTHEAKHVQMDGKLYAMDKEIA